MLKLLVAGLVGLAGLPAMAQPRVSPRLGASAGNAYIVVFRPGADMARGRELLQANGFDLIDHPDLLPGHLLAAGPRGRIPALGGSEDVVYILPASPDLVAHRRVVGCGGAIREAGGAAAYAEIGPGWPRDAGGAVSLHYAFESMARTLEENAARGEVERAFREWQKYANVSLNPGASPDAPRTIAVRMVQGAHGDAYPFDGPGGALGHTFYPAPPNPEPIAGDIHLDADEDWRIGENIDLYTVALHEIGHALGLGHSDQPGAVMYPYYRFAYGLTSDDIAGIQDLYGAPPDTAPEPPPPPVPPAAPVPDPVPPPAPPSQPPATGPSPSTDKTPPTLRITSPAATIVSTTNAALTICGTAADDTGVAAVKWSTSSGDAGTASGTTSWSAAIPLYPGNTVVTVRAYDEAGNSSWRAFTVSRR